MFDLYFIVFIFIFSISCFFEIIVFNEEVLLTLCFLAFIFFIFNNLSETVSETFISRAAQFENDLFVSFKAKQQRILSTFMSTLTSKDSFAKLQIVENSILFFLTSYAISSKTKLLTSLNETTLSKMSELSLFEKMSIENTQKQCIRTLLYPLIFKTSKSYIQSFNSSVKAMSSQNNNNKISQRNFLLKSL
jgi:hypothetical protein|tara:strand:+ start:13391 stop:13963 length:573 start_codon:yes stop_codon:yes gene_type:complete